jgi:hypothetical protein
VRTTNGTFAELEVETAGGLNVLETEPRNGQNSGVMSLVAGQTYLLRLRSSGLGAAAYAVDLLFDSVPGNPGGGGGGGGGGAGGGGGGGTAVDVAEVEPNDLRSDARLFDFPGASPVALLGVSTSKDDRDFFAARAGQAGELRAQVVASDGGIVAALEVEDELGNTVLETEPNNGLNTGSFLAVAGRLYYFRLRSPGLSPASYRVVLSFS